MSDIRRWLETIGPGQNGDAFQANDIDMDLLMKLDDQTLQRLFDAARSHIDSDRMLASVPPLRGLCDPKALGRSRPHSPS